MSTKPALRPLDFQPVYYQGRQMWLLRDPLRLSDMQLLLPPALAHLLTYFDGAHDLSQVRDAFAKDVREGLKMELIEDTLAQLDEAYLLDNERSRLMRLALLKSFREQSQRPAALAGLGYPADPQALVAQFEQYGADDSLENWNGWQGRALVSPHIDYQRGGPVYARVWRRAKAAVAEADLVLIFGTDHNGGLGTITLTGLPYATPFGLLPAAPEVVQELAQAIGPETAFELELNHREEHSIELSAVWLHYICRQLGRTPPPMVPILCGSFHHFVSNGSRPAQDGTLNAFVDALKHVTAGKKVLAVASVDLAHVGPTFGDSFALDGASREQVSASDGRLITAINQGDYERFYNEIAAVQDRNRICGFSSTYLMLRYLEQVQGVQVAYEQCPADEQEASFVSICGLLLS